MISVGGRRGMYSRFIVRRYVGTAFLFSVAGRCVGSSTGMAYLYIAS